MGAWGVGSFDNDDALDWLADFTANDFRLIDRTLAAVAALLPVDELDAPEACEVLAAAECVAAAGGYPAATLPDEVSDWLTNNQPIHLKPDYVTMAQKAVARVLAQSELRDLWAETDEYGAWTAVTTDLLTRLRQIS
jgi:hypothetical protein